MSDESNMFSALERIPSMQRRRLSGIAKLALESAMQCLQGDKVDYIVWCSQYGDEEKTLKILQDVLLEQTPSPTLFSTSVHNAISGLYSIFCQDTTVATSIAASWTEALLEAYTYLKTQQQATHALVVYYDQPLPSIYQEGHYFKSFSLAAIVSLDHANLKIDLENMSFQNQKYKDALHFNSFWQDQNLTKSGVWNKC